MLHTDDGDLRIYNGDSLSVLQTLPDGSVDCVVTSPPYWGLRDYGTGTWEDGDAGCDHQQETRHQARGVTSQRQGRSNEDAQRNENFRDVCGKCGATRVDGQLGLEATPEAYVAALVAVFREVRRVLSDTGTVWLNLGDSYANSPRGNAPGDLSTSSLTNPQRQDAVPRPTRALDGAKLGPIPSLAAFKEATGLKQKDLVGIPWRVAFALQADGWYLRSDIVWSKPNPMPESVTDRPTKSHEFVFLLSKQPRYFFDQEAVREQYEARPQQRLTANVDMPLGAARIAAGVQQGNPQGGTHVSRFAVQEETLGCVCIEAGCGSTWCQTDCGCACHADMRPLPHGGPVGIPTSGRSLLDMREANRASIGRNVRSVWEMEQVGRPNGARHTLDDGYFATIETEEQAYWLGFLYADGYLGRRHVDLQLADVDHDHVLAFREALRSSATVNQGREGRTRVVISSKRMADDLRALGLDTKERIPALPAALERHFVRGVFDGDGSAWKYLPAGRPKWRYGAQMLGKEPLLTQVREILGLRGRPKLSRGIHVLAIAAADDIARLYAYLYTDASVWLERKRIAFPQAQIVAPDVWPIATQPYAEAHFATYPEELVRRCLLAGCPEAVCGTCGKPRERIVERDARPDVDRGSGRLVPSENGRSSRKVGQAYQDWLSAHPSETVGWSDCGHDDYRPGTVLDPFGGSGTTGLVARKHGRRAVLIELSAAYCDLAARRCQQLSLFAEPSKEAV